MIKTILKIVGVIIVTYVTISSCTVTTVFILEQSIKNTKSSELFPN